VIESASPEVIYVPTYSPTVVYGGWSYPYYYYPPMYAPYPPGAGFITFTAGVVWGAAVWGNCNWGGSDVDIDIDHHNEFNRNTDREPKRNEMDKRGDKGQFKHDPEHRKGVNYKSKDVANKMGASPGQSRVTRDQARGFDRGGASASQRPSGGASAANRPASGASTRPSTTPSRGSSSTGASTRSGNSGALSGSRSPSIDRSASSRGAASRASSASRGGMSRGGASRGGGGGRRR
jgi:hypothetical protein